MSSPLRGPALRIQSAASSSAAAAVLLPGDQLLAVDQATLAEGELHVLTLAAKHTHSLKIYRHVHRM